MINRSRKLGLKLLGAVCLIAAGSAANATSPTNSEYKAALALTPNLENGARIYRVCVACHGAEGWGNTSGAYPQIAGQLATVVIKQLADIRAGNRDNPIMRAFTSNRVLGGAQDIADVAAYIAQLPMTDNNGRATAIHEKLGAELYKNECSDCHGDDGEGDSQEHIPALHGQHYHYLVRQFNWIRNGRRKNADPEMVKQIKRFSATDVSAVMAYAANLSPPKEKLAPPGYTNPDFPEYWRGWRPSPNAR